MIEITYQMVLSTLQTIALIVGIAYYLIIMRNSQRAQQLQLETRQLQLYNTMAQSTQNMEWILAYLDVLYNQEFEDYENWLEKYGVSNPEAYARLILIGETFQEWGILAEQNAFDPELLYKHFGRNVIRIWEKIEPIVSEIRVRVDNPTQWLYFEKIYHELKKIEQLEQKN